MPRHHLRRRPLWERAATTLSATLAIAVPLGVPWLMLHPAPRHIDCRNAVRGAAECR